MGTYLKFDGGKTAQSCRALGGSGWTSTGSIVLTCFARILQIPTFTAPLIGVGSSSVGTYHAIWLTGRNTVPAAGGFGVNGRGTTGENVIANLDIDTSGNPLRMGRIYKLQSILAWDAAGGGLRMAFNVDGVQITESALPGAGLATAAGDDILRVAGTGEGGSDQFNSIADIRYAHVEVFQAMFEFDRTISFDGAGAITTVDADSEPFTDLSFSGSASDGALWLMDEASGNPQDSSGNTRHATLTNGEWADDAGEPTYPSLGLAQWDFEHVEGLDLRESDAPTVVPQPDPGPDGPVGDPTSGEMRLAPTPRWWWEDGEQVTQLSPTTQISTNSTELFEGETSILADGGSAVNNRDAIPTISGQNLEYWIRVRFHDPGGTTAGRIQRLQLDPSVGGVLVQMGVTIGISAGFYSTRVTGAATPNQATTVPISAGPHELMIHWVNPNVGNDTVEFYVDGSLERTESATAVNTPGRIGIRERGNLATNDHGFWDHFEMGVSGTGGASPTGTAYSQLVESSGSIVLQLMQPAEGVKQFLSVTIDDEQAGTSSFEIGTITYAFRHSTDGGSSWGSSTPLTDANLQALKCVGNGDDVLEITPTHTSDLSDMASGAFRQLQIEYEPAVEIEVLNEGARFPVLHEETDAEITVV